MLNDIAGFYSAPDASAFAQKTAALTDKFARFEARLGSGPYFEGERFTLVDVVFGPVFRYFDAFDRAGDFGIFAGKPKLESYRRAVASRPSVRAAVVSDYNARLWRFLQARNSHLSRLIAQSVKMGASDNRGDANRTPVARAFVELQ